MLSKLGNMEAADATEKLTSTLNGYGMEASQATDIVNKLVAVDNVAATSTKELAVAMQYSAAVAKQTGVSFEQLVSYIATVSETTRQNAESIGQGFKTMLTRMQDIKGGKLDEDKLGINNVELALKEANIELRVSRDEFRDFGGVLEELAGKWDGLSGTQQAYISKSIAGIRQVNLFTVLMENMGRALELQEVQFSSAGLAVDRYKIYMESLEAKLAVFQATLQGLFQDAISTGVVSEIIDFGTAILKLIDNTGGLEVAIKRLIALFGTLKLAMFGLKNADTISVIGKSIMKFVDAPGLSGGSKLFSGLELGMAKLGKESVIVTAITDRMVISDLKAMEAKRLLAAAAGQAGAALSAEAGATIPAVAGTETLAVVTPAAAGGFKALAASIWGAIAPLLPFIAAGAALVAVGVLIEKSVVTQKEAWEKLEEAQKEADETQQKLSSAYSLENQYRQLTSDLSVLTEGTDEYNKVNNELISVRNELAKTFPSIIAAYDIEGNVISDITDQVRKQVRALQDLAKEKEKQSKAVAKEFLYGQTSGGMGVNSTQYSDTASLEKAYKKWQNAPEEEKGAKFQVYYDELQKYGVAMNDLGAQGAKDFVTGVREGIAPAIKESLIQFSKDIATTEVQEAYKGYDEFWSESGRNNRRREKELEGSDLGGEKRQNAIKYGYDEELNSYLYSTKIPETIEQMKLFQQALDDVRNTQPVSEDTLFKLEALKIKFDETTQTFTDGEGNIITTNEQLAAVAKDLLGQQFDLTDSNNELWDSFIKAALEAGNLEEVERLLQERSEQLGRANDLVIGSANAITDAIKEQNEQGYLSADTIYKLAAAGVTLADGTNVLTQAHYDEAQASLQAQYAKSLEGATNVDLTNTLSMVNAGLWANAAANLASAEKAGINVSAQRALLDTMHGLATAIAPVQFSGGGGGGGGGKKEEDPRIKEIENEIKAIDNQIKAIDKAKKELDKKIQAYEKEKDTLDDLMDDYNEYIDVRKESLELAREEEKFSDEAQKKAKSLARLKTEIALLALDNSEEARAKRLGLEEEAAGLEEEIKEDSEDRKLDLQLTALDDLKKAFEDSINAQKDAIDLLIEAIKSQDEALDDNKDKLKEQKDILSETKAEIKELESAMGSAGGAGSSFGSTIQAAFDGIITKIEDAKSKLQEYGVDFKKMSDDQILEMANAIQKWEDENLKVTQIRQNINQLRAEMVLASIEATTLAGLNARARGWDLGANIPHQTVHQGGLIEEHHDGEFAGNLRSNEVFAKLLKGEYVATENQMDQFMNNILPRIASYPQVTKTNNTNNSVGDMTFNMPITVNGSLDKNSLPELKDSVIREINMSLERRGIRRNATNFSM